MTFTVDLGLLGVFVGIVGVILTMLLGLRPQVKELIQTLESASKDVAAVRQKVDSIWDVLMQRGGMAGNATVTLQTKNLGEVKVSARPGDQDTEYVVQMEKGMVRANLVIKLSKTTGLESQEKALIGSKVLGVSDLSSGRLLFRSAFPQRTLWLVQHTCGSLLNG